jgi:hypothetical protein
MLTVYRKATVAIFGALMSILAYHGIGVPEWINESTLGMVFNVATPALVYLIPNTGK